MDDDELLAIVAAGTVVVLAGAQLVADEQQKVGNINETPWIGLLGLMLCCVFGWGTTPPTPTQKHSKAPEQRLSNQTKTTDCCWDL